MGVFDKLKNVVNEAVETVSDTVNDLTNKKPDDQLVMIDDDDQLMNDAIRQAKNTLPDYLAFFSNAPKNTFNHRVKALFSDDYGNENIWLVNISHNGQSISGKVGNVPNIVACVDAGEVVSVPLDAITDWAFDADGLQYGNYTVYAMFERMHPAEVEQYVDEMGFCQNPLETPDASFADLIADLPEADDDDDDGGRMLSVEEKLEEKLLAELEEFFEGENPSEREYANAALSTAKQMYRELEGSKYEDGAKLLLDKYEQKFLAILGQSDADKAAATVGEEEEYFGLTLRDYAVSSAKFQAGVSYEAVLEALGMSQSDYEAGSAKWAERWSTDTTYQMSEQYTAYFADADNHPKLGKL